MQTYRLYQWKYQRQYDYGNVKVENKLLTLPYQAEYMMSYFWLNFT